MSIKVLLVDDHRLVRDGFKTMLEQQPGMEIIGCAENGKSAIKLARVLKPDVVVMDINMPGIDGVEATREILSTERKIKIVVLSMYSDRQFVEALLKAGVSAYILKDCSLVELCNAIRIAAEGHTYFGQEIANIIVQSYLKRSLKNASPPYLTVREKQVLQLIAGGKKTSQVAVNLKISVKTVETYRRKIAKKLKLSSIAELTKYAIREGITTLD